MPVLTMLLVQDSIRIGIARTISSDDESKLDGFSLRGLAAMWANSALRARRGSRIAIRQGVKSRLRDSGRDGLQLGRSSCSSTSARQRRVCVPNLWKLVIEHADGFNRCSTLGDALLNSRKISLIESIAKISRLNDICINGNRRQ